MSPVFSTMRWHHGYSPDADHYAVIQADGKRIYVPSCLVPDGGGTKAEVLGILPIPVAKKKAIKLDPTSGIGSNVLNDL